MKIKLTRDAGGFKAGATLERADSVAELLIANGAAVEAEAEVDERDDDQPKTKQTRRSTSRKAKASGERDASRGDEAAGQEGGGTPLPPSLPTAG